ncbi:protein TASOR [Betta splendens]|uniref:Protein TASOR n=1 Tax=Betta splendens TaxID=158456 RepID=A0A9W2XTT1_BETSP|nr:protein TASOR [Betta splendens]
MSDSPATARPRRVSAAAELGANAGPQDGEVVEAHPRTEAPAGPDRAGAAAARMDRRNSVPPLFHQRHMPKEPLKFHIPRKTKDNRALFQYVSTESREYEDMLTILTSSFIDPSSAGCFTYCQPRLVHCDLLEKEFVEKRREMKAEGRTDKELEESYCFLQSDTDKLHPLCEKGLIVGHSWITVLGNPKKGVYLCRFSDLLQMNALNPGSTGELIIFKVMKGKVKSIYENMKNLLDPTPRFDSHISKNSCKVTSLSSYRAFELTQQYFYEYIFDELRQRPRQVCPYAVVSFHFKGKDSSLPSKPLAPLSLPVLTHRLNSQSSEASKERAPYTVWTGDLVRGDRVLFQISFRSFSPPLLPHRIPEKLEIGCLMRLDQVTKVVPSVLFSYNLYNNSQEVVTNGYCCSLLEVIDRCRPTTSVTKLLQELELKNVVLVTQLTERGFLFLLSSVQMATPTERGDNWKRCLQALFVFPESRAVVRSTSQCASSFPDATQSSPAGAAVMPRLSRFIPALHHALIKARANPPPELSAGVEHQVREYLMGLNDGKVRQYPMGEYDSKLDERGTVFPAPRHHRVNLDGYLRSYLYSPTFYLLSVACARTMMEAHCGSEEQQEIQQLIDHILTCKRNAENEVNREESRQKAPGRKRRLEQETAERTLKFLRASQAPGRQTKVPVEGSHVSASPGSLESVVSSVGLRFIDLKDDGSELAARLLSLLTGLSQAASGVTTQSLGEGQDDGQRESPFEKLATKLGLPTNCDIDLRRQEDLEEQTGSISSLEGFSPSSHSGETNHHGAARAGGRGRRAGAHEEEDEECQIPWVLIPITGLCSERYTHRDRNIPQDPRFQHLATATSVATATKPMRRSPTPSPQPSPPPSPFQCPSPEPSPAPSPSQCPSPDPSPTPSPSQCPSPEPSSPPSPSEVLSPEPSPPTSTPKCPSPQPSPFSFSQYPPPPSSIRCQPLTPNELNPLNKEKKHLAPTVPREFTAVSMHRHEKPQGKEKNEEPSTLASIRPCAPPAPERRSSSPPLTERRKENAREVDDAQRELKCQDEARNARNNVKVSDFRGERVCEKQQQEERAKDVGGASVFASSVSSSAFSVRAIDSLVDKHLGDFSSEVQLLLQEQSIHYNVPQSPHSTSNPETSEHQRVPPHASISQFSQYVSFYNPCPPVQDYVHSLQSSISSMLTEFERRPSLNADDGQKDADAVLASSVSAFVAGIRSANAATDNDEDISASSELTAADVNASDRQTPAPAGVTLPVPSSATAPPLPPAQTTPLLPHWQPQQSGRLEISRTVTQDVGQSQGNSTVRTAHCTSGADAGSTAASSKCDAALPKAGIVSKHSAEAPQSSEPVSSSASGPFPGNGTNLVPPPTALSSLISQLQPEVFSSLVEIIKDVKRNSLQFYLHSTEPEDPFYEDVTELLLKQGNTELNPLAFLSQETSDDRLLVIIRNKDISGHIHKIPGLMSLKRHHSVVFVGIDALDDIRNNSYIELFVSGGCIVSDELVLSPDFITHDRLASLLMFLEQHSSPECVWKWKVHCKTHRKLKEQARFRKDAANLLDVLSTYQKRQIVEFLPYHHCDMMNHQSPDLDCLIELQGRYTQYRHTVFLTEHQFEKFAAYSGNGIIVASIKEILHDFTRLVGYREIKDKQQITDELLAPKEHISSLSCCDQPLQPASGLPSLPHLSDQLVPDGSSKDPVPRHSDTDFEALRQAISQLRAERQRQQQHPTDSQIDCVITPLKNHLPDPGPVVSGSTVPPSSQVLPTESVQLTHGRKAVAATLDSIYSSLHPKPEVQEEASGRMTPPAEMQRKADAAKTKDQGDGTPVKALGVHETCNSDVSTPLSIQTTAAVAGPANNQPDSTSDRTEKVEQQGEPASPNTTKHSEASSNTASCSAGGGKPRNALSGREQPSRAETATPENKPKGSITMATGQNDNSNPVLPRLQPITQHLQLHNQQQQQQHINEQLHIPQRHSHHQHLPQQPWGMSLLQPPHIAHLPRQPFPPGHMLAPLSSLGGIRSLLGPTSVWTGGLSPAGALVWGIPQAGTSANMLRGYRNPAGQGSGRYRGGQRGGGFNGM